MVFLRVFSAAVAGAVFLVAGFLKLMDPVGTSLIVEEYFRMMHLQFMMPASMAVAVMLPVVETVLGISLLLRIRLKELSWVLLLFETVFTGLTLYVYMYDPISDCGCFGEAIKLSNRDTFIKNVVLLLISVFIVFQRRRYRMLSSKVFEWSVLGFFTAAAALFALHSILYLPPVDFTVFAPGTYLEDVVAGKQEKSFMTTFTYEKDGEKRVFTMDSLPDDSWTYVSSETVEISQPYGNDMMPLPLSDGRNVFEITEITGSEGPYFISVVYDGEKTDDGMIMRTVGFGRMAGEIYGIPHIVLSSAGEEITMEIMSVSSPYTAVYTSDFKSLVTLNRSNGGLVYVNDGEIINKWPYRSIPDEEQLGEYLEKDSKVEAVKSEIMDNLFWEMLCFITAFLLLIGNVILKRYNLKHNIVVTGEDDGFSSGR